MRNADKTLTSNKDKTSIGTKDQILEAALRLFTKQGFDATPTAQISKEANVSTGTLFHYFPNKNSILEQLYLSIKKELSAAVQKNDNRTIQTKQRLYTCLKSYIEWAKNNPQKAVFLDQFYHSANISQKVKQEAYEQFNWMKDIVKTAVQEGVLKEYPLEFHLVMISSIITGVMNLVGKTEMTLEQLLESGLDMLLKN